MPPTDVIPVNGWIFEFDGGDLVSPNFTELSGLNKKTGTIEVVDGGTNRKFYFSDGIIDYGGITIKRTRDGSADDKKFAKFIDDVFANGTKRSGTMVQRRHGVEVLRIIFKGLLMNDYALTDFNTHGSEKSDQTYQCKADYWEEQYP